MSIPKALKSIAPYIQRANELEKMAPLVSFYCRTYAAQLGISVIQGGKIKDDDATRYLISLMDRLEKEKQTLNPNNEEGRAVVELFALKMFKKADDADRAGRQDEIVAKLFYSSSILMEVTKQFGDFAGDIAEKQKYARWKAAEINKAVKNGTTTEQQPPPAPVQQQQQPPSFLAFQQQQFQAQQQQEEEEEPEEDKLLRDLKRLNNMSNNTSNVVPAPDPAPSMNNSFAGFGSNNNAFDSMETSNSLDFDSFSQQFQQDKQPTNNSNMFAPEPFKQPQFPPVQQQPPKETPKAAVPPPAKPQQPQQQQPPKPQQPVAPVQKAKPVPQPMEDVDEASASNEEVSLDNIMEAQKYTKFAMSALQFQDVNTARKYLKDALKLLK